MTASRQDIERWFDAGVAHSERYMVIICDTFDNDDYPAYFKDAASARYKMKWPGEMQKVMECYDLEADKDKQMKMHRAFASTID